MDCAEPITVLSLCSGGGGLDLGFKLAVPGAVTIGWVEWEAFAAAELVRRMEAGELDAAPLWTDLRTFDGRPWRGAVDFLLAGYPCQPFSTAGRRGGEDDPRHLWPHVRRAVEEVQPWGVYFENVSGHFTLGLREVCEDLERLGYAVAVTSATAAEVGASHKRERVFILGVAVGVADRYGVQRRERNGEPGDQPSEGGSECHRTMADAPSGRKRKRQRVRPAAGTGAEPRAEDAGLAVDDPQAAERRPDGGRDADGSGPGGRAAVTAPGGAGGPVDDPARDGEHRRDRQAGRRRGVRQAGGDVDNAQHGRQQHGGAPAEPSRDGPHYGLPEPTDAHVVNPERGRRQRRGDGRDVLRPPGGVEGEGDQRERGRGAADGDGGSVGDAARDDEQRDSVAAMHGQGEPDRGPGRGVPLFPPGPGDRDAWARILAACPALAPAATQPDLRLLADGLAIDRSRYLRLLGNGVVPLQAAYAFVWLWMALEDAGGIGTATQVTAD